MIKKFGRQLRGVCLSDFLYLRPPQLLPKHLVRVQFLDGDPLEPELYSVYKITYLYLLH